MPERYTRREFLKAGGAAALTCTVPLVGGCHVAGQVGALETGLRSGDHRLLYVVVPGIRNYMEYGGIGVLVYDVEDSFRLVRRIPTLRVPERQAPENVKGVCASAATGRLYFSTIRRLVCMDLAGEQIVWNREYEGGCDRMSISPDGSVIYLPSLEGPHWLVLDARSGDVLERIVLNSRAHNTVYGRDGRHVYMAGLASPFLAVADTSSHQVVKQVGPFSHSIRPFTVNGSQTLCYVNVNELLGFEIGDIRSGKKLHRVQIEGFRNGPVKRHGCPSHGVGLTPDEREVWVVDGPNSHVHVFDNASLPPRQIASIRLRDQPGWVSFSLDGRNAYLSTGEIIDVATKRIVATLQDESGWAVASEKLLEIAFRGDRPVAATDQFGVGLRV